MFGLTTVDSSRAFFLASSELLDASSPHAVEKYKTVNNTIIFFMIIIPLP